MGAGLARRRQCATPVAHEAAVDIGRYLVTFNAMPRIWRLFASSAASDPMRHPDGLSSPIRRLAKISACQPQTSYRVDDWRFLQVMA